MTSVGTRQTVPNDRCGVGECEISGQSRDKNSRTVSVNLNDAAERV